MQPHANIAYDMPESAGTQRRRHPPCPWQPQEGAVAGGEGARSRETWGARCQGQLQDVVAESPEQGPDGHPDGEASG